MPQLNVNGKMLDYDADEGTHCSGSCANSSGSLEPNTAAALPRVGRVRFMSTACRFAHA